MTVICFRDGILASDSGLFWENAYCGTIQKIFRLSNGLLYGAAGEGDDRKLRDLIGAYDDPGDIPVSELEKFNNDTQVLVVRPTGECWYISLGRNEQHDVSSVEVLCSKHDFYSIGFGKWIAFGAMAHGASAEQAVEIAVRYAVHTRGPVQTLALK
jgi:hypothetical protein